MAKTFSELIELVRQGLMVRTDSREVREGEVFVAMPGVNIPGRSFIPAAIAAGAKYIVDSAPGDWATTSDAVFISHENPAMALGELARAYFQTDKNAIKMVGVTGTNGKTTITYMIEHLLAATGLKVGVLGTVNYRWPGFSLDANMTTPDCWHIHDLLHNMHTADVDVAVMEVSSHALDQHRVAGIDFDVAVLTNVTQDHLDYHGDMEHYFTAKSRLFFDVPHKDKVCVVNYDDPYGKRLVTAPGKVLAYGLEDLSDLDVCTLQGEIVQHTVAGLTLRNTYKNKSWDLDTGLVGKHNASNLLAAQGACMALGVSLRDMKKFAGFNGVPGRLERVENERGLNIFVDYAHTPDALDNVLSTMAGLQFNRMFVVFGCGGDRDRTKRPLMAEAVTRWADVAVLTSDNPRHEEPLMIMDDARPGLSRTTRQIEVVENPDRYEAIYTAVSMMTEYDVLVVAGKGHETYQQIGDEYHDFSDVEAVQRAVKEL